MGLLNRAMFDTLFQAPPPLVMERVPCPEWGEDDYVYVKMLTCSEAEIQERISIELGRGVYGALVKTGQIANSENLTERLSLDETMTEVQAQRILDEPPSMRVPLIVATVCDDHGKCLFTDEDVFALNQQSPVLIKRLHDAAWKLNNTGQEAVEAAVKNFATSQRNDSGTAFHTNGAVPSISLSNS